MADVPPPLTGVLETVLYFADQDRAEEFYRDVLGMRLLAREPGRSLFFRAGSSVFLLFRPEASLAAGTLPAHGARGPVHSCLRVPLDSYDAWKSHLEQHRVAVIQEQKWPRGRSFYFRDPDGNLLEIADQDLWPD
jgi:catechol 2,3-dioxygenase-like lactoylglutathione lyase family enzyme